MLDTNCEFLRQEIMDVIRLFRTEEADFIHSFDKECGECVNRIEYEGETYEYRDEFVPGDEIEYKRLARRSAKLSFYKLLQRRTGRSFPWGALTGIRPVKLARSELEAGRDFTPLFKKFGVCAENIELVKRVMKSQKDIVCSNLHSGADIFVSIPFCPTKCEYCSFITAPVSVVGKYADEYTDSLVKEIESLKDYRLKINSVYIGGGTPFCLSEMQLNRIYDAIDKLGTAFEFTVEAGRPDTFTPEKLSLSRNAGVTRLCVNPQSFSDETLKRIGRSHTAGDMYRAYNLAAEYGFSLNIDLIAGLPGESADDFRCSAEKAVCLAPDNITVHMLCLKSGSRLKEKMSLPYDDGTEKMSFLSGRILTDAGYEPYYLYRQKYQIGAGENVGWTLPGKECAYNVDVMEEICSNIAVGANAISKRVYETGGRIERLASPKDIPTYLKKCPEIMDMRKRLFLS